MLDKKHKLLELKTKALVDSLFIWNYKTNKKWRWIEFVDYTEYDYSQDVKNIDFLKSEKEWKTLVKLYEEERDLSVYFVINLNETFYSDLFGNKKIDLVYEIVYLIWLSAVKAWDKVWAYIFDWYNKKIDFAKKWKQNFINIVNDLNNFKINTNFISNEKIGWLSYFNSLKINNSLVFYLTDKLEIDNKNFKILSLKNDLIVCNVFNSFENDLNNKWLVWFNKNDNNLFLDLDNKKKISEYKKLRENKIHDLKRKTIKNGWKYVLLDENKTIYKELSKLFKK